MSKIKFKLKDYLNELNDNEREKLLPYINGVFTIGLLVPILTLVICNFSDSLLDKLAHTDKKSLVNEYASIGVCYSNQDCRHNILDNQINTDTDLINLSLRVNNFLKSNKVNEQ